MILRLATFLTLVLGVATCVPPDLAGPLEPPEVVYMDALPILELYSLRSFSGLETRSGHIINNATSFQVAWDSTFANYDGPQKPLAPRIDFEHNVVLLVSAGSTPRQLVWFGISLVRHRPEHLEVLVESFWPTCDGLPLTTNPVHIVSVPRVATQAVFTYVDKTTPCP